MNIRDDIWEYLTWMHLFENQYFDISSAIQALSNLHETTGRTVLLLWNTRPGPARTQPVTYTFFASDEYPSR